MKNTFKEYHQFSEEELVELWKNCIFVFDTNTLLNMYRYSRETVDAYFKVLKKLKKKKQVWIPYQVGYEFYENRIKVISENEKSYDKILEVLEKAKKDIETDYKDHPFLDIKDISNKIKEGLSNAEKEIRTAKNDHPKWLEKDDVLKSINYIFSNNIGKAYEEKELEKIKTEGKDRYENNIPPGFKDKKKEETKRYGDLILWYQIINKAKETQKPIVFISGDVKEDWWLEKDGKRIMPLPQLKKEMYEKADVDFHIHTPERFLELSDDKITKSTISEIRKIRELEEKRMLTHRRELMERERDLNPRIFEKYSTEYIRIFEKLERLFMEIDNQKIHPRHREELDHLSHRLRRSRDRVMHGDFDRESIHRFHRDTKEFSYIFDKIIHSENIEPKLSMMMREFVERLEYLNHRIRRYL
jgi:hypothetical protein